MLPFLFHFPSSWFFLKLFNLLHDKTEFSQWIYGQLNYIYIFFKLTLSPPSPPGSESAILLSISSCFFFFCSTEWTFLIPREEAWEKTHLSKPKLAIFLERNQTASVGNTILWTVVKRQKHLVMLLLYQGSLFRIFPHFVKAQSHRWECFCFTLLDFTTSRWS